jgi:hypothetical protein
MLLKWLIELRRRPLTAVPSPDVEMFERRIDTDETNGVSWHTSSPESIVRQETLQLSWVLKNEVLLFVELLRELCDGFRAHVILLEVVRIVCAPPKLIVFGA